MPLFGDTRNGKRFEQKDKSLIYRLFDAFVESALVNDSAIDFNTNVSIDSNQHYHFKNGKQKFSSFLAFSNSKALKNSTATSFLSTKALEKEINNKVNGRYTCRHRSDLNNLFAHLNWLWSLEIWQENAQETTCGVFGENMNPPIQENSAAFPKDGLWSAGMGRIQKSRDFYWLCKLFGDYFNQNAIAGDVEMAKRDLERICLSYNNKNPCAMENAILHFCNPNEHIHIFVPQIKRRILSDVINGIKMKNGRLFRLNFQFDKNDLKNKKVSVKDMDSGICRIYDELPDVDTYDAIMHKYFYKK